MRKESPIRRLAAETRSAVALWMGLTMPVLIMAMGMGIEVGRWSAVKVNLQRTADAAAIAGATYYNTNSGQANLAQNAATHAAYIAQINGASGQATPAWTAATKTLSDNMINVQIIAGIQASTDVAVMASVSRTVALAFGSIIPTRQSVTISATSIAEVIQSTTGPQPCILGLNGDENGVTTDIDITLNGNANIDANNCAIRSDGAVTLTGNAQINAGGTYAAGAITTTGNSQIIGGKHQNAGQIADPYASDTALQTALTTAAGASGQSISLSGGGSQTLQPGSYNSISASGQSHLTLAAGLYYVQGNISLSGQATLAANGVTIVSAGTLDLSGGTVSTFTAPTASDANSTGGLPGILFASSSSSSSSFTGNAAVPYTGLIYYPKGQVRFTGNATDGSTGCSEIIAGSVTLTGNANLGANCTQYGTKTFGSALTYAVALVE